MAKSTNTYFESVQNKSVKSIESLIAEINNVSLRDVKGKVMKWLISQLLPVRRR